MNLRSLDYVMQQLKAGSEVRAASIRENQRRHVGSELSIHCGQKLCLRDISDDRRWPLCIAASAGQHKCLPVLTMLVWEVDKAWQPENAWPMQERSLWLKECDLANATRVFYYEGWRGGFVGELWGSRGTRS